METILSPYIYAVLAAWIIAQGAKYLIMVVKSRSLRHFRHLYISGNMPSAHSATVLALTTLVALRDGIDSGLFGLAALFAAMNRGDVRVLIARLLGGPGEGAAPMPALRGERKGPIILEAEGVVITLDVEPGSDGQGSMLGQAAADDQDQ